jgi:hypothetical protein
MKPVRHLRRLAAALAGLACAWLGIAVAAPAAATAAVLVDRAWTARRKSAAAAA